MSDGVIEATSTTSEWAPCAPTDAIVAATQRFAGLGDDAGPAR
jgi:hypothetical protein